jgi:hypothetical protein
MGAWYQEPQRTAMLRQYALRRLIKVELRDPVDCEEFLTLETMNGRGK